jgi:hypothetical protein
MTWKEVPCYACALEPHQQRPGWQQGAAAADLCFPVCTVSVCVYVPYCCLLAWKEEKSKGKKRLSIYYLVRCVFVSGCAYGSFWTCIPPLSPTRTSQPGSALSTVHPPQRKKPTTHSSINVRSRSNYRMHIVCMCVVCPPNMPQGKPASPYLMRSPNTHQAVFKLNFPLSRRGAKHNSTSLR